MRLGETSILILRHHGHDDEVPEDPDDILGALRASDEDTIGEKPRIALHRIDHLDGDALEGQGVLARRARAQAARAAALALAGAPDPAIGTGGTSMQEIDASSRLRVARAVEAA